MIATVDQAESVLLITNKFNYSVCLTIKIVILKWTMFIFLIILGVFL